MPSPWAIFRAASNSSKKPLIFSGFSIFLGLFLLSFVLSVGMLVSVTTCGGGGSERPEPHGREPGVRFQPGGVGVLEDHRQGFVRDGGPDVLQVFAERDNIAVRFLDPAVAAEDSRAGPRQAKMASAPTTPSAARRGIHS